MERALFALTLLSIALGPFYLWESGLPQVAHLIMALAIGLRLLFSGFHFRWRRWWNWLIAFAFYTLLVNVLVFFIHRDSHSLFSSLYYLFNALVFVHIVSLAERVGRQRFLRSLHFILWTLLALELVLVLTGQGRVFGGTRAMGTFNDPNQMANWLVVVAMCIFAIGWFVYRSWLLGATATGFALVLMAFSASRSGALGLLVILLLTGLLGLERVRRVLVGGFRISRDNYWRIMVIGSILLVVSMISLVVAGNSLTVHITQVELAGTFQQWLARFADSSPWMSLEGRGYDRLWKFPEYLVFGAGEGANHRWSHKTWFLGEIHSTPAGTVFYYGLLGSSWLVFFIWMLFKRLRYSWLQLSLLAPFAYSVGTYNLRNWFLWLGMAVLYVAAEYVSSAKHGVAEAKQNEH